MSVNNVNPNKYFGGTWISWGSGRVPVGVNTGDTNFNVVEKTGGSTIHAHTSAAHTHTINGHTHTGPSHTHTMEHTHTGPSHTHSFSGSARIDLNSSGKLYVNRSGTITNWSSNVTGTMTRGANEGNANHSDAAVDGIIGASGTGNTSGSSAANTGASGTGNTGSSGTLTSNSTTPNNTGSSSTLQPYITCYMWKRTA